MNIIIFGGGGDLALRKLLPALYRISAGGYLDAQTRIIGVTRNAMERPHYIALVEKALAEYIPGEELKREPLQQFLQCISYFPVDVEDADSFQILADSLSRRERSPVMYYLAIPPHLYATACTNLQSNKLIDNNSCVVLEKPIGESLASAKVIHDNIADSFPEARIFRIDHYLGKETVQNLLAIRFANIIFEEIWERKYIDHVQITVAETVGVEGRWGYYDRMGALKDMVQNHLLQLLCLIAMEPPTRLVADEVRAEKIKVLRALRSITAQHVRANCVRGQYVAGHLQDRRVPAYTAETDGAELSHRETYVALKIAVDTRRWAGVPFYVRTGKRLPRRYSEIVVQFRELPHNIFNGSLQANKLVIRLQPDEGINLMVMHKQPRLAREINLNPVSLNLSMPEKFNIDRIPDAYERLLLDAISGDPTLFMSRVEVESAWSWIDAVIDAWNSVQLDLNYYAAGSMGPRDADLLLEQDHRHWHLG